MIRKSRYPVDWDEDTTDCGACYVLARYIEELHERLVKLEREMQSRATTSTADTEDPDRA